MFCPKCGCVLEDKVMICRECGYHIPRKMMPDLSEEQNDEPAQSKMMPEVKKYIAMRMFGVSLSAILVCSFLMVWGEYTAIDGTSRMLYAEDFLNLNWGGNMDFFKYVPTMIPILGVMTALIFVLGSKGWIGVAGVIMGFSSILMTVAFSVKLSYMYMESGYAVYLALILCIAISFAGYYCVTQRNRLL